MTESGDFELDLSELRRTKGHKLESLINESDELDAWQKI